MNSLIDRINNILAEWDPINVGKTIAIDEYRGYISIILKYIHDKNQLILCLEDILVNKIGLEFDRTNKKHFSDLMRVCEEIIQVYNSSKALI